MFENMGAYKADTYQDESSTPSSLVQGQHASNSDRIPNHRSKDSFYISHSLALIPLMEFMQKYHNVSNFSLDLESYLKKCFIIDPPSDDADYNFPTSAQTQCNLVKHCILYLASRLPYQIQDQHVLLMGFQKSAFSYNGVENTNLSGLRWIMPNSAFEEVQSEYWEKFRIVIGNKLMIQLLCKERIFLQVGENNMWQITGPPLNKLKEKNDSSLYSKKIKNRNRKLYIKRLRRYNLLDTPTSEIDIENDAANIGQKRKRSIEEERKNIPSTIYFSRKTILFSHPTNLKDGFPQNHELNTVTNTSNTTAKVIYSQIFQTKRAPTSSLAHILPIIMQLKANQLKYGKKFIYIMDKYCPIEWEFESDSSNVIQHSCSGQPCDDENDSKSTSKYIHLIQQCSQRGQVSTFIHQVLNKLIPEELFGSVPNKKVVYRHISRYLSLSKFDTLTLHEAMQGIHITDCKWAFHYNNSANQKNTQFIAATSRVANFIQFLFNKIVIPLVKSYFYCTETNEIRSQIFYYRQDVWKKITSLSLKALAEESDHYEKLTLEEVNRVLQSNSFSRPGVVRLLPKKKKIRAIVNLSKKYLNRLGRKVDTNTLLKTILYVMQYEFQLSPWKLGCSVFSPREIYYRLLPFVKKWKEKFSSKRSLYFVSVDVSGAYDSIPQDWLMKVTESVFQNETYLIVRYFLLQPSLGTLSMKYECQAIHPSEFPVSFESFFEKHLSRKHKKSILVDQVVKRFISKQEILKMLKDHISQNIVRLGSSYFRQTKGIPQGSVLSPLLCSHLYAHLERSYLSHLPGAASDHEIETPSYNSSCVSSMGDGSLLKRSNDEAIGVLIRFIDDFLYITTDEASAHSFLNSMHSGTSKYGIKINGDKTKVNFNLPTASNINCVVGEEITWCGFNFDSKTLQVTKSYEKYFGSKIKAHTNARMFRPGQNFAKKLKAKVSFILSPILLDGTINTVQTIYINIYQCALFVAMHFHFYSKISESCSSDFLLKVVEDLLGYFDVVIKLRSVIILREGSISPADELIYTCLILRAFCDVLKRKPTNFLNSCGILQILKNNESCRVGRFSEEQIKLYSSILNDERAMSMFQIKY